MTSRDLTAELACHALSEVGFRCSPAQVRVEARDERWVVFLPQRRLAWFAASDAGLKLLQTERRVLRLLEARCTFDAPRVILESAAGGFDVRTMVPGTADPWSVYAAVRARPELGAQLGRAVGSILAEQHGRIRAADVADWLPPRPQWPESRAWVSERLPHVVDDAELLGGADAIMGAYEDAIVTEADCALIHGDVGFHNLGIDRQSHRVHGIFDYEAAAWADRHHDFRYLVFDEGRDEMLDAARSVYEPSVGREIHPGRVLLYNAACALTYLAHRSGTLPEQQSCGRTLEQDLRWSRFAISRALRS